MLTRLGAVVAAALTLAATAEAQNLLQDDIVDRVLAIVGDSAIRQSQIDEEMQRMALGGLTVPPPTDPAFERFYETVLESWIDRLLVILA